MTRRFPDATADELTDLCEELIETAGVWLESKDIGSASSYGRWNLYNAIESAVLDEHDRAVERVRADRVAAQAEAPARSLSEALFRVGQRTDHEEDGL